MDVESDHTISMSIHLPFQEKTVDGQALDLLSAIATDSLEPEN
jgi:hypothetical protein